MKTLIIAFLSFASLILTNSNNAIARTSHAMVSGNEVQCKIINDLGHDFTYMNGAASYTILKDGGAGLSFPIGTILTTTNSKGKVVTFVKISTEMNGKSIQLSTLIK
jgi:hypothetical protein